MFASVKEFPAITTTSCTIDYGLPTKEKWDVFLEKGADGGGNEDNT